TGGPVQRRVGAQPVGEVDRPRPGASARQAGTSRGWPGPAAPRSDRGGGVGHAGGATEVAEERRARTPVPSKKRPSARWPSPCQVRSRGITAYELRSEIALFDPRLQLTSACRTEARKTWR